MNRIKELRKANNLTQKQVSEDTQIPQNTLSNYENGKREPSLFVWKAISEYFGVDVPYLQGETSEPRYKFNKHALNNGEGAVVESVDEIYQQFKNGDRDTNGVLGAETAKLVTNRDVDTTDWESYADFGKTVRSIFSIKEVNESLFKTISHLSNVLDTVISYDSLSDVEMKDVENNIKMLSDEITKKSVKNMEDRGHVFPVETENA